MLNTKTIFRDSGILLVLLVIGAAAYKGWSGLDTAALAVAAGGLLGLLNLFLIGRVVQRMAAAAQAEEGVQAPMGPVVAGLLVKSVLSVAGLFAMVQVFDGVWVMVGLATVVASLSLRSIVMLFSVPDTAQEA